MGEFVQGETAAEPGVPRDFRVSYFPVREAEGCVGRVSDMIDDVTAQKRLERERQQLDADSTAQ